MASERKPRAFTLLDLQRQRGYEAETRRREQNLAQSEGSNRGTNKALLRYRLNQQLNYERDKRGLAPVNMRGNVEGPAPARATVPLPVAAPAAAPVPAAAPPPAPAAPAPAVATSVPPPVAVTDPASQISPEEQAARLRARLLLAQGSGRGGRLAGLSTSQLGYRMLIGSGGGAIR